MAALFLTIIGICTVYSGMATAEISFHAHGDKRSSREETNCTDEELEVVSDTNSSCSLLSRMLGDVLLEANKLGQVKPSDSMVQEIEELVEEACTPNCYGVRYELYTKCFPEEESTIQRLTETCSSNGGSTCVVAELLVKGHTSFPNSVECMILGALVPGVCMANCTEAIEDVVSEVGCCASYMYRRYIAQVLNLANLTIEVDIVKDGYTSCNVMDPGYCPNPFEGNVVMSTAVAATHPVALFTLLSAIAVVLELFIM